MEDIIELILKDMKPHLDLTGHRQLQPIDLIKLKCFVMPEEEAKKWS